MEGNGYFHKSLQAFNLLKLGLFRVRVRMLIMVKMLIMDAFAVQTQCETRLLRASVMAKILCGTRDQSILDWSSSVASDSRFETSTWLGHRRRWPRIRILPPSAFCKVVMGLATG
jgi:hypothetical protein